MGVDDITHYFGDSCPGGHLDEGAEVLEHDPDCGGCARCEPYEYAGFGD